MTDKLTIGSTDHARAARPGALDRLVSRSAGRVYGEPVRLGDTVMIPVAVATAADFARPVAVVEAGPAGVRVRPVIDRTRVGFALAVAAITVWRAARR